MSSSTTSVLLFALIIGLAVFLRCFCLSADPPLNLSWSQDVNTDPDQYTSFARSKALWGSWDLFGHNLVLCLNSALTLISFFFFKLLGVGRWQANFVAATLSFLTLIFFYLAIKKGKDKKTALLATFFLGINYILVMYSRSTFAEVSVIFFIALGIYFFVLGFKRGWLLIPSGVCFAVSIFFGKMLAMFILLVCLGVVVFSALEKLSADHRKIKYSLILFFAAGSSSLALLWFFLIYSPFGETVSQFVSGMSVGLYGSPRGFESPSDFIYSLFSFGGVTHVFASKKYSLGTDLFYRMPFLFILSLLFLLGLFFRIFKVKGILKNLESCSRLELFFALWLVVGIFALMPWNYRPLRYQVFLIPPMCALAAFCLADFLNPSEVKKKPKRSVWFWIFSIPVASFLVFHTMSFFLKMFGQTVQLNSIIMLSFFLSFPLTYVFHDVKRWKPSLHMKAHKIVIVAEAILLVVIINGAQFWAFARNTQYSLLHSSEDLGQILGQEAVISGPYSPTLVLDNELKVLMHMFLPWKVDPDLFLRHPITHLALEAEGGQREQAFTDYPEVMKNARPVATYRLRNFPVQILRVAESSGNPKTKNYKLSDFEKAKLLIQEDQIDSAIVLLNQFVSNHPRNFSGYMTLAEIYYDRQDYEKAVLFLERASTFDPTSSFAHEVLGAVYFDQYNQERSYNYRLLAIEEWEKALKLHPQNIRLLSQLTEIRGY
ncbi:MAG: glycosyltransferase family 39 protein [candidate division Zixibacteria bacterium]|nr:glycosyltransferase family 39 protein [candidate division Zixibacteria bacterium]